MSEFKAGRVFMMRLGHGSDVLKEITDFARREKISAATFTAIGALKNCKLAYYDQKKKEYSVIDIQGPCEITSCVGNVSIHNGGPFSHAHAVIGDDRGGTKSGHLLEATVFAAEVHLQELHGPKMERGKDEVTGLALWQGGKVDGHPS
ncbi:MAG: PPC domain-containing DNA-binding protein [Candidatus Hadarchaeota archaeon]